MKSFINILRAFGAAASLALCVWMIVPLTISVFNIGSIAGLALGIWGVVTCVTPLRRFFREIMSRFALTRFLYRIVNILMCILLVYGASVTALIYGFSLVKPPENATVIVLGAQVHASGNPSSILAGRINVAEEYLRENPGSIAILTGGKGSDEVISEAQCMYNTMTADGIAPERLIMEDKATTTAENFSYSKKIIEQRGLNKNIAVATDRFHQLRARIIAEKQNFDGEKGALSSNTRPDLIAVYTIREWFGLVKDFLT